MLSNILLNKFLVNLSSLNQDEKQKYVTLYIWNFNNYWNAAYLRVDLRIHEKISPFNIIKMDANFHLLKNVEPVSA